MSDAVWVSFITTIPTIITILVASYLQIRKAEKVAEKMAVTVEAKDSAATEKLGVIHDLVNSNLTVQKKRGDDAEEEAEKLKIQVKELEAQLPQGDVK
jgi:hypothetical protein